MSYLLRIKANILPYSEEQQDVKKALTEWEYRGNMYDLEEPCENCELCGHPDIRYQFEIVNKITDNVLLVGSECITKFSEIGVVEHGQLLVGKKADQKVHADRRKLVADAKFRKMMQSLIELARKEESFNIEDFIKYFRERGAFTPNQLATVLWRLEKNNIQHDKSVFKTTIRRNREKAQLRNMEDWKLKKIWACLSPSQKAFYSDL